jgi:hypothetical protein
LRHFPVTVRGGEVTHQSDRERRRTANSSSRCVSSYP